MIIGTWGPEASTLTDQSYPSYLLTSLLGRLTIDKPRVGRVELEQCELRYEWL
jgi:hypothetical protein